MTSSHAASLNLSWLKTRGFTLVLVLLLVLMGFANFQQARTIDSQRQLIHELFKDSLELSAKRMQQGQKAAERYRRAP